MFIKPSQYLQSARRDFVNLPADVCDEILDDVEKAERGMQVLPIIYEIPVKYHARMNKVWTLMVYKILFANATKKYTLVQRHKILQKSL